jgi:hypothetical protein
MKLGESNTARDLRVIARLFILTTEVAEETEFSLERYTEPSRPLGCCCFVIDDGGVVFALTQ